MHILCTVLLITYLCILVSGVEKTAIFRSQKLTKGKLLAHASLNNKIQNTLNG